MKFFEFSIFRSIKQLNRFNNAIVNSQDGKTIDRQLSLLATSISSQVKLPEHSMDIKNSSVQQNFGMQYKNDRAKVSPKIIRLISQLGLLGLAWTMTEAAMANQIPTTSGTWSGTGTTAAATKDTPSGLRTTVSISGSGMTMGVRNNTSLQTANTTTVPTLPATTNGIQVLVTANSSCVNTSLTCNNLGTVTFNFTNAAGNPIKVKNPVIHMSRLGGALSYTSGSVSASYYLGAVLSLTTPASGASVGIASGARGFTIAGNKISPDFASFPTSSTSIGVCTVSPNLPEAGCGSIPVTGLVSSLSFNVDLLRNNTSGSWQSPVSGAWAADGIYFTVSFDEDYGDAPASYDPTTAASHIISDLTLGATIDADNTGVNNGGATGTTSVTPSPNAIVAGANNNSTNGDGADEDAISTFPALTTSSTTYALTVPISGASSAGQVCGWIDLNGNNIFDNPTERACSSFASGATSAALNWTGLSGLTAGNKYVRLRASYDTTGVQNPTGRLNSGEVEDYQVTISTTTPVIPSICSVAGGIRGTNLFANDGNFGTGSSTPAISTSLPPGRTTYNFQNYGSASPTDGNYAIVNYMNQNTFSGNWHNTFGHTTGTVTDQMMVVNAAATPGTFYTETLTVPANQNIEFSAWILNLLKPSGIKPNISFVINRIGVDDNNNGTIDELGEGQVVTNTGLIPETTTPTWVNYGAIINTGNATQIEYRLVNNAPGGGGNDLVLDDLFAAPCSPISQGNITGTLYRDTNANNLYNSGTDATMPANIAVNLKSATGVIVATAYTDASGNYNFTNVPAGSNYTIEVALTDTDIPSGATATANPTGANTTGQQSGITVASGATLANQNFGFSAPVSSNANVILVKRITAINGDRTQNPNDNTPLNVVVNDPDASDNNANWPNPTSGTPPMSTFLLGAIDGGKVKPGDTLEYTIYFLNAGDGIANNVRVCDRITGEQKFLSGSTIQLQQNSATPTALTSNADADRATFYASSSDPALTNCNFTSTPTLDNGAIVVDVTGATGSPTWTTLPGSTGPGTANTYGLVRFTTKVNP